jgi:hypothetical protein
MADYDSERVLAVVNDDVNQEEKKGKNGEGPGDDNQASGCRRVWRRR